MSLRFWLNGTKIKCDSSVRIDKQVSVIRV
jgi:hypothetical protein